MNKHERILQLLNEGIITGDEAREHMGLPVLKDKGACWRNPSGVISPLPTHPMIVARRRYQLAQVLELDNLDKWKDAMQRKYDFLSDKDKNPIAFTGDDALLASFQYGTSAQKTKRHLDSLSKADEKVRTTGIRAAIFSPWLLVTLDLLFMLTGILTSLPGMWLVSVLLVLHTYEALQQRKRKQSGGEMAPLNELFDIEPAQTYEETLERLGNLDVYYDDTLRTR